MVFSSFENEAFWVEKFEGVSWRRLLTFWWKSETCFGRFEGWKTRCDGWWERWEEGRGCWVGVLALLRRERFFVG